MEKILITIILVNIWIMIIINDFFFEVENMMYLFSMSLSLFVNKILEISR